MAKIKKITDAEIMNKILKKLRYSANAFSKELGYPSHSSIYHVKEARNLISTDMRNRIIERFPEVNYDFLIKGEEPILNNEDMKQDNKEIEYSFKTEDEILFWLTKNLDRLSKESKLFKLIFNDLVEKSTKEAMEQSGYELKYIKKES